MVEIVKDVLSGDNFHIHIVLKCIKIDRFEKSKHTWEYASTSPPASSLPAPSSLSASASFPASSSLPEGAPFSAGMVKEHLCFMKQKVVD